MRGPLFLLVVLLAGCGSSAPPARGIELEIGDGQSPPSEYHRVPLRLSRARSIFAPAGLLLEAELRRPSGARARLVLDLPTAPGAGETTAPPVLAYTEHDAGGRLLFQAVRAAGRVELSADPSCPCQTGRLELLFTDPGPDAALGTADDRVRRLGNARIRVDDRPFCHARGSTAIREDLLVLGARACPVSDRGGAHAAAWSAGGGWAGAAWNQDRWYDEGWTGCWEEGGEDGWGEGWTDGYFWDPEDGEGSSGEGWDEGEGGWVDEDAWESGWEGGESGDSDDGWESDEGGDSDDGGESSDGGWDDESWGTDDEAGDSWSDDSGDSDDGWDD